MYYMCVCICTLDDAAEKLMIGRIVNLYIMVNCSTLVSITSTFVLASHSCLLCVTNLWNWFVGFAIYRSVIIVVGYIGDDLY